MRSKTCCSRSPRCTVRASASGGPADEHAETLLDRADSELERRFLDLLDRRSGRRLPERHPAADRQPLSAAPTSSTASNAVAVFIDGPIHDQPDKRRDDAQATARLEDAGYDVIRFHHAADWAALLDALPDVFGSNGSSE